MISYQELLPLGTGLIVTSASFCLGLAYSNWPFDYFTLYSDGGDEAFKQSLDHLLLWSKVPRFVHWTLHGVIGLGYIGCFIKIFKPDPDQSLFEYGTLVLFVVATVMYLTNIRLGILSAEKGEWGDVDEQTGINVIAASTGLLVFVLIGILLLQFGLWYAVHADRVLKEKYLKEEAAKEAKLEKESEKTEDKAAEESEAKPDSYKSKSKKSSTSGSKSTATTAQKRKA
ncbi:Endoplasmic reticulum packaging chaperone [Komagataella phaffii CBS 7435]|uniref:Endoplasmic reticulum packaging chaperone n=2 Tax=Komagataella phaffii TaxID=460519 RepID=C4QVA3_KOMPG|nr:Endoplasmic reticulum packaging chaperone [Komagataella phaffii GS115]CAH2445831.1 Endoplasmic reticulum packaging chaperone [Komagataella phaffii CBS 7435]CAY67176.1 Endoplasmic reticulum packaging chaperone [Komagataella phaffii GS115]CCA36286.1 Endoplasmic reticulum packaging chaperone [Komagataella phaffii CBS 7435]